MNNPTREEFEALVEKVRRLEQRTDEIKAVRVEVASADVENRLDNHLEMMKEIDRKVDIHTQAFMRVEKRLEAIAEVQKLILERLPEK